MSRLLTIILNWNGKEDTLSCLRSLEKAQVSGETILVVDNGSKDRSSEAIREQFPQVQLIQLTENLGFAEGNNVGLRWGLERDFDLFLLLNNDTLVAKDLVDQFIYAADQHPQAGIFGAKIFLQSDPGRFDHFGGNWDGKAGELRFVGMREEEDGRSYQTPFAIDYVCGAALCIRRSVLETTGLFDSRFFLYWEENDLCFRAKRAGFGILVVPQARIWHKVSATINKEGKPFKIYFHWRNYLLWLEKNRPLSERWRPYGRILIDLLKDGPKEGIWKMKRMLPKQRTKPETQRALQRKAKLWAIRDYCFRQFGRGSSSLLSE